MSKLMRLFLLLCIIAGGFLVWRSGQKPIESAANQIVPADVPNQAMRDLGTFRPEQIGFDAPEIANPGRGLYRWKGQTMMCPAALRSDRDAFNRWTWRQIEPRAGEYDWSKIHAFLDEAEANGQRAWIGLGMAAGPNKDGPYMPDDAIQPGWGDYFENEWYPDYKNPALRVRLEKLLDAFVAEFGNDQRIIAVQMRSYGRYGEGYLPWNAPKDHVMWADEETARWLIDAWHSRLTPKMQLSILLSNNFMFRYAMTKRPYWSITRDALGMPHQMANIDKIILSNDVIDGIEIGKEVADRWKYAPMFTEMIGESGDLDYSVQFSASITQVISYHVSYVSNGNFAHPYKDSPWNFWQSNSECPPQASNWTQQDIDQFVLAGKRAGYRYSVEQVSVTFDQSAQELHVTTLWNNAGVAPIYEAWRVQFELRDANNPEQVVWSEQSEVDLRTILPTSPGEAFRVDDVFQLTSPIPPGVYHIRIRIPAINRYVQPLQLAMQGQQSDGSYLLGTLTVP